MRVGRTEEGGGGGQGNVPEIWPGLLTMLSPRI